ncbi:uncharacterized protein [Ptychodera flava]|uniref:uncharacterized protein isoform X2 n=1 Tax=Ptychodera flava TaxID=63121 RepID=UPI003969F744
MHLRDTGPRMNGQTHCLLRWTPAILRQYLNTCPLCVQLVLQTSVAQAALAAEMGLSHSNQNKPGEKSQVEESTSSHLDDSIVSERSTENIHGKSPKNRGKGKKSNKKRKGSDDSERHGLSPDSTFNLLDTQPSTPKSILAGSRRESMTSTFSSVSQHIEEEEEVVHIEDYNNSPKKYRTWRRAAKPKQEAAQPVAKPVAATNGTASQEEGFEMVSNEPESFVMVTTALEKFDTDQKIDDIPTVQNDTAAQSQAKPATPKIVVNSHTERTREAKYAFFNATATYPSPSEPANASDQGLSSAEHVQVSISKRIQMREEEAAKKNQNMYTETDLDKCPVMFSGQVCKGNPMERSNNPHPNKNNPKPPTDMKTKKGGIPRKGIKDRADFESSNVGKAQACLDLSSDVHSNRPDAMVEKLQRSVSNVSSKPAWDDGADHSWQTKRLPDTTPNTKARNKTASLYGTLPRNQMPTERRLLARGGVMQTNLDEFEYSKSVEALNEVESPDETVTTKAPVSSRKALFSQAEIVMGPSLHQSVLHSEVVTDDAVEITVEEFGAASAASSSSRTFDTAPKTNRATAGNPSLKLPSSDLVTDSSLDLNDPDLDIYSADAKTPEEEKRLKDISAGIRMKRSPVKPKIVSIGEKRPIRGYGEREWKGNTANARAMRMGYAEIPSLLNCNNLRSIRGDNYCAIRAALYQSLVNNFINVRLGQDLQNITQVPDWFMNSGYDWVQSWTFGHRLRKYTHPIEKMKECLRVLQDQIDHMQSTDSAEDRERMLLDMFNGDNSEVDIQLMEAVKLLMLYNAIRLHEDNSTGKEVPVFVWLMYARDTSETPEKLMLNHFNLVGDSGGLEQVEMFLLGYTLGVTLKVVRPSQFKREDFITHYPDDHIDDWPSVTMIAEDDRHYNIAMQ